LLLERREPLLDRCDLLLHLALQRGVLGGHLGEAVQILDVGLEGLELLEPPRRARVLGGNRRSLLGVVPEPGRAHVGLERGDALAQRGRVKGSPRAAASAHGSRPAAGACSRSHRWWPRASRYQQPRPSITILPADGSDEPTRAGERFRGGSAAP